MDRSSDMPKEAAKSVLFDLWDMMCASGIPIIVGATSAFLTAIHKHRADFSILLGIVAMLSGGFVCFVVDQYFLCQDMSQGMRVAYAGIIGGAYNQILLSLPRLSEKVLTKK